MNIDKIMDELLDSEYNLEDISKAYQKACDRAQAKAQEKEKKIADARSKVLANLTEYFIAVWGKVDKNLIKEFEDELIGIEAGAGITKKTTKKTTEKTDDEKLREFIEDLMRF